MSIPYVPGTVVNEPCLKIWNPDQGIVIVTVFDVAGARLTRANARNCLGGSPVELGIFTYTCTTSAPARFPAFATVTCTVTPEELFWTTGLVNLKVV